MAWASPPGRSPLWGRRLRTVRHHLQRRPSMKSMRHVRARIKVMTDRSQLSKEVQVVIRRLKTILRRLGNHFNKGNASIKFRELDQYLWRRLFRILGKKRGRNVNGRHAAHWTSTLFKDQGRYHLRGTMRCTRRPRNHVRKTVCNPCAGEPHARIERGLGTGFALRAPRP